MKLFNMFRKSEKAISNNADVVSDSVNRQLFVEEQAPVAEDQAIAGTLLTDFLNRNYEILGFNDGYTYPNAEVLNAKLRKLSTDFRIVLDKMIDEKRSCVNELKFHLINTRGVSERLEEGIHAKITEVENLVHELDLQKVLSVEDEGMIAPVINNYRLGFLQGLERYNQEKILACSTKLFN